MRYTTFGTRTGIRVSEYALGSASFGTNWGGADLRQSRRILDRFAEAGGTLIDTADVYGFGQAEEVLGELLGADRDSFVLAGKYTLGTHPDLGVSRTGNNRKSMKYALHGTLKRLGTDHLDVYLVHQPDSVTPTEEIVGALDDLVRAGDIRHGGLSNFPAWRTAYAASLADRLNRSATLAGLQIEYNLLDRGGDREILPAAQAFGLGVMLYSPLGGGLLTGKYRTGEQGRLSGPVAIGQKEDTPQKRATLDALLKVSADTGEKPARIAMAWLRHRARQWATPLIPVIGPRTLEQLEDYLAALDLTVSQEHLEALDAVSAPAVEYPETSLRSYADAVLGGVSDRFDRVRPVA
ncbi:oxidoreductase [Kineosporia sp. NBRC 101677]|uniref:aldo/keto reductase n=1 Tax=Kineosporia sp. NBRC 101677 TaxID=3032197 RepID=UPI0024A2291E|nr:aldo/keto reductase [Kineosporia sp. NBRC 101677]GLY19648.1 oxidoreductase [Kineosporia sp. NBRC 101677]